MVVQVESSATAQAVGSEAHTNGEGIHEGVWRAEWSTMVRWLVRRGFSVQAEGQSREQVWLWVRVVVVQAGVARLQVHATEKHREEEASQEGADASWIAKAQTQRAVWSF